MARRAEFDSPAETEAYLAGRQAPKFRGHAKPVTPAPQPARPASSRSRSSSSASSGRPRLSTAPVFPGSAVQVRDVPVVGSAVTSFEGAHWVYQLMAIFLIVYVGLAVYARVSGKSYSLGWGWGSPQAANPPAAPPTTPRAPGTNTVSGSPLGVMSTQADPATVAARSQIAAAGAGGVGAAFPQFQRMSQFNPARVALS